LQRCSIGSGSGYAFVKKHGWRLTHKANDRLVCFSKDGANNNENEEALKQRRSIGKQGREKSFEPI
jgi:hypothetical protein